MKRWLLVLSVLSLCFVSCSGRRSPYKPDPRESPYYMGSIAATAYDLVHGGPAIGTAWDLRPNFWFWNNRFDPPVRSNRYVLTIWVYHDSAWERIIEGRHYYLSADSTRMDWNVEHLPPADSLCVMLTDSESYYPGDMCDWWTPEDPPYRPCSGRLAYAVYAR